MISDLQQYFRERERSSVLVGVCLLGLLLVVTVLICKDSFRISGDLELYYTYSLQAVQGKLPYRDFPVEYPPLSLLPILLPQWLNFVTSHSYLGYSVLFSVQNLLIVGAIGGLLLKVAKLQELPRSPIQILMVYAFLVVLNAPLVLWRYDIFCALLTLWAVWLVLLDRPLFAGAVIGLGFAAKLYPILLIPVFVIHYLPQRKPTAILRLLLASAIVPLLLLPLLSPLELNNVLSFVSYHKLRGLQLESLPSGLLLLAYRLGLAPVDIVLNYGAFHLDSPIARPILQGLPLVVSGGLAATWLLYFRRTKNRLNGHRSLSGRHLTIYTVATLLVLLVTNKVFSPQYLIWVLPFMALLPIRPLAVFSAISVLSVLVYPVLYGALLGKALVPILLLNLRNGLLVLLILWVAKGPTQPSKQAIPAPKAALAGRNS